MGSGRKFDSMVMFTLGTGVGGGIVDPQSPTGGILMGADIVLRRFGRTGLKIVEKLMGLLVTVIAVQLILDGVAPMLARVFQG